MGHDWPWSEIEDARHVIFVVLMRLVVSIEKNKIVAATWSEDNHLRFQDLQI